MKPLNQQERKSLYLQFLALYIITLLVVIITMHFFYKVPQKELEVLREQKEKFKSYDQGPIAVLKLMADADAALEQISQGKDVSKNEANIMDICTQIKTLGDAKANPMDSVFMKIRDNYIILKDLKKSAKDGMGTSQSLASITAELNRVKDELVQCKADVTALNAAIQK